LVCIAHFSIYIFTGGFVSEWTIKPIPHFLVEMRGSTDGGFSGPMPKAVCDALMVEIMKREKEYKASHPDDTVAELLAICYPF
jgi:hypothetical protein